jgi:hypothetical protein
MANKDNKQSDKNGKQSGKDSKKTTTGSQTEPKGVRQNLLKYGSKNGNISGKELMKISEATGKSQAQIIKQLDKLNAAKDLPIGLGQGAVRRLIKEVPGLSDGGWGAFGTGAIGSAVANYGRATNAPTQSNTPWSGSTNLYGSLNVTPEMKQSFAGLIPLQKKGGMQINAKGGLSPKVSNDLYLANKIDKIEGTGLYAEPTPADTVQTTPTETVDSGAVGPMPPPPEEVTSSGTGLPGGGEGAEGATYLKSQRSRWKRLGISTQGANALSRGLNYSNVFGL